MLTMLIVKMNNIVLKFSLKRIHSTLLLNVVATHLYQRSILDGKNIRDMGSRHHIFNINEARK